MKRIRTGLAAALSAPAAFLLLVALLYAVVVACSLHAASAPWEAPFDAMAGELADFLKGDSPALSPALFTEREMLHMADVRALFEGAGALAAFCAAAGVALLAAAFFTGGLRPLGNGLLIGMGAFAVGVVCVGIWAAVDFEGWFIAMHELVFSNDLWLLDPAESMLIQMLPLSFFTGMVRKVALWFCLGALAFSAIAASLRRDGGRRVPPKL